MVLPNGLLGKNALFVIFVRFSNQKISKRTASPLFLRVF
jgi:hypothetical protein